LIAAPLSKPHTVGGWYRISGLEAAEEEGAAPAEEDEDSLLAS
jgi:hypothetical protein